MTEEQTIKKVTKEKNPNRVAAGKKSYETHMIKLKEDILTNSSNTTSNTANDTSNTPSNTPSTNNATPSNTPTTTSNTSNVSTSKSYVAHMYGVGILTVLAVGLCMFYYSIDIKRVIKREKKKDSTATAENTIHRRKML